MSLAPRLITPEKRGEDADQPRWLPYRGRGIITLVTACAFGPGIAALVLTVADLSTRLSALTPALAFESLGRGLAASYVLGMPIAIVAGAIVGFRVARDGKIPLHHTALIAFLTPFVPLLLGGPAGVIFGLLYGIPAAIAGISVQLVGTFVWMKASGQRA
jgi:hypothetical protein